MSTAVETERQPCWRCDAPTGPGLACATCEAPLPVASGTDLFAVLGLPRQLAIDPADLERRFHAASRTIHPDRHQTADPRAQQLSVAASATLNRAYRTLRDPIARGRYWLELHGLRLGDDNRVPPSLAALVFETQEQLEALRGAPDDAALRARVRGVHETLAARVGALIAGLRTRFAVPDGDAAAPDALASLKTTLAEIAYLRTLLGDVEEALGETRGTDRRH